MLDAISTLLQAMLAVLGAVSVTDAGAIGVAVAVIALTALTFACALHLPAAMLRSAPHPLRAIDVSTLLSENDPDAAGHPRPRAPGVAHAA